MKTRRLVVLAAVGAAAAIGVGTFTVVGADPTPGAEPSVAQTTETSSPQSKKLPSAEDLEAVYNRLYDRNLSPLQRGDNIQGLGQDPQLLDPRGDEGRTPPVLTADFTAVKESKPGIVIATGEALVNGKRSGAVGVIPFVFEDNQWKVEKQFICTLVNAGKRKDPACL
jgi:hypothetical protein